MFDWLKMLLPGQRVLKDGVLCRQRKLVTECKTCGCVYKTPMKKVDKEHKFYGPWDRFGMFFTTKCPQCFETNEQNARLEADRKQNVGKEAANEDNA